MITIYFFKDGFYIKGHDHNEFCNLISYSSWACAEDCMEENDDVYHYYSDLDDDNKHLGLTYIKINIDIPEHVKIYHRFKIKIELFLNEHANGRIGIVHREDELVSWKEHGRQLKRNKE